MDQKHPLEEAALEWLRDESNWDTAASCENISEFASLIARFHRHMIGRPPIDVERMISVMMVWQRDMIGRPDLEDEERMATLRARLAEAMENNHMRDLTQKLVNALNRSGHAWDCALNPYTVTGSGEADFVEFDGTEVCTCGQDELMTEAKAMGFTPQ